VKPNTGINLIRPGRSGRKRRGATAVEFALVCPIVFAIMFGMLEISRMSTIIDAARTSVIAGAREARVANASNATIEEEMENILDLFGVRDSTITVSPAAIGPDTAVISVDIEVPFNAANGLFLVTLSQPGNLTMDIEIDR